MTHEELDRLGPDLEKRCNVAINERFPTWSRYAVDQMVDRTVTEIAPDWHWMLLVTLNRCPEIRFTQYVGDVE